MLPMGESLPSIRSNTSGFWPAAFNNPNLRAWSEEAGAMAGAHCMSSGNAVITDATMAAAVIARHTTAATM